MLPSEYYLLYTAPGSCAVPFKNHTKGQSEERRADRTSYGHCCNVCAFKNQLLFLILKLLLTKNTFKINATSVSEILYYIHKKGIEGFLWSSPHGHGERNVDGIVWQKYFRILDVPPSCQDIILAFSTL